MSMSCGVPQGSIIGPFLWNLFYNKVLEDVILEETVLVAYADDLAIITMAKTKDMLENRNALADLETKKCSTD